MKLTSQAVFSFTEDELILILKREVERAGFCFADDGGKEHVEGSDDWSEWREKYELSIKEIKSSKSQPKITQLIIKVKDRKEAAWEADPSTSQGESE